jgi:glyoxylase-like metal-dependent hydrolase (beta-lactamase superfamily II)
MTAASALRFPLAVPPPFGTPQEIAPGVLWLRLPLPFRRDHVNVYAVEDGDGWALIDTGIGDPRTQEIWEAVLAGPLRGQPLTRLFVTHAHPDHAGLAGWLTRRHGISLWMPRAEYLFSLALQYAPSELGAESWRAFYRRHGLDALTAGRVLGRGYRYLHHTTGVPGTYRRLRHDDSVAIGARSFRLLTGGGHALEQAMLYCAGDGLLFAGDQVLGSLFSGVTVTALEPEANALGAYLRSLAALRREVAAETLVLPGHGLPFVGLPQRIDAVIAHHAARCAVIVEACREVPCTAADLLGRVFPHPLDEQQTGFAFGEIVAHLNHLLAQGEVLAEPDADGCLRYTATG